MSAHIRDLHKGARVRVLVDLDLSSRGPHQVLVPAPSTGTVRGTFVNDDLECFVESDAAPGSAFKFDDTDGWRVHGEAGHFEELEVLEPAPPRATVG